MREKTISEMSVQEIISSAIARVREGQPTREQSLVITKLQEAMHWHNDYELALRDAARRAGVGSHVKSNNAPTFAGVTLTEPIDLPGSGEKNSE